MTPVDPRAIEVAARAEYEHAENDTWEEAHPDDRADWLESARVALEAAQGIMWAQALREAATRWCNLTAQGIPPISGYMHLRARADELDPQ